MINFKQMKHKYLPIYFCRYQVDFDPQEVPYLTKRVVLIID